MNEQLLARLVDEAAPALVGRVWGKVWQMARVSLAADFRLPDNRYLFISVDPIAPRLYLIERPVRALERQSLAPSNFVLVLRKHLGGARLRSLSKDASDRIVRLTFEARDVVGGERVWTLVAQLTGRAANLLLLDAHARIVDALRPPRGEGQEIGDVYQPPPLPQAAARAAPIQSFAQGACASLSAAADDYYQRLEAARVFDARAAALRARLRQEIEKRRKLERRLENDADAHGDAETHKRIGDLLLANLSTAERLGSKVRLTDYYAEDAPQIELEIDQHTTLQEEAARRFARYTKAKRAAQEITQRLSKLRDELDALHASRAQLEQIIARRDEAALADFADQGRARKKALPARRGDGSRSETKARSKSEETVTGARRYLSSDGYEILVGRAAKDNDHLTFRVARPHDTWLHAADYPGSHVVIRNPQRAEVPHRTLIEAAQLAAKFSQASRDAKVAVHYTQRKFLSKPKGVAPGLVRMSSFRTLLVEPRETAERI